MTDDLIRRKDALNFEITVEGPREAEEAILRTSQGIMDYIKSLPAAGEYPGVVKLKKRTQAVDAAAEYWKMLAADVREMLEKEGIIKVVRCKDCRHRDPEDKKCDCGHDILWQLPRQDDWFCGDGERREDDND